MPRYSQRLPGSFASNDFSQTVARQRASGARLLDLTISNPTEVLSDYPHDAMQRALTAATDFTYHPQPFGSLSARATLCDYYAERGAELSPAQIALTASTSEAYALLFKLFCDPGDEVLVPVPSYPLFEYLAQAESVRLVPYRLSYDGSWFIDFDNLAHQVSARCRALIVVNPNNPTGSFLKRAEAERVAAFAAARQLPIVADEVFFDYECSQHPNRLKTFAGENRVLSFSLNGLSKAAGMPQMKLAWMVINGPERERAEASDRLEILLDTYLSVNTPVQLALSALLEVGRGIRRSLTERIAANLASAHKLLAASPLHVLHVEGGWSAILEFPQTQTEEFWIGELVKRSGIVLQPGYFFDMPAAPFGVASLITDPAIFREALEKLVAFVR